MIERIVQCPFCRCASSAAMYVARDGCIHIDHDCPSCGHRGLDDAEILVSCLRDMGTAGYVDPGAFPSDPATAEVLAEIREARDIEPMYRTPDGTWYGLGSKRRLDVKPTPPGERDLFDPRYDHIGDVSAVDEEGSE